MIRPPAREVRALHKMGRMSSAPATSSPNPWTPRKCRGRRTEREKVVIIATMTRGSWRGRKSEDSIGRKSRSGEETRNCLRTNTYRTTNATTRKPSATSGDTINTERP